MSTLKSVARGSSLLIPAALFAQVSALAQAPAPAADAAAPVAPAAAPTPAPITASVIPYGLVQSHMIMMDSQRQNAPDFQLELVRFGFKANLGIGYAQIETGLTANTYEVEDADKIKLKDGKPVEKDGQYVTSTTHRETNKIGVRRADAGLKLKPSASTNLQLGFGRVRPGGAGAWGVMNSFAPDQYAYLDGMLVDAKATVAEGSSVGLTLAYGNALAVPGDKAGITIQSASLKKEKAIVAGVSVAAAGVTGKFFYGGENNAPQKGSIRNKEALVVDEATILADTSHIEGSLGYDLDNLGVGVCMQQVTIGNGMRLTKNEAGKLSTVSTGEKSGSTKTTYGLGINGDSGLFGATGFLQADDKLMYGMSVHQVSERAEAAKGDATATKDEKDADIMGIVIGGGYALGGLGIELNLTTESTKGKTFSNSKGEEKKETRGTSLALETYYVF